MPVQIFVGIQNAEMYLQKHKAKNYISTLKITVFVPHFKIVRDSCFGCYTINEVDIVQELKPRTSTTLKLICI